MLQLGQRLGQRRAHLTTRTVFQRSYSTVTYGSRERVSNPGYVVYIIYATVSWSKRTSKEFAFEWYISDLASAFAFDNQVRSAPHSFDIERGFVQSWRLTERTGYQTSRRPPSGGPVSFSCHLTVTQHKKYNHGSFVGVSFCLALVNQVAIPRPGITESSESADEWFIDSLNVKFKVNLLSKEGEMLSSSGIFGKLNQSISTSKIDVGDSLREQLLSDGLKARCELTVYGEMTHTVICTKPTYDNHLKYTLGPHMGALRDEEFLTDFVVVVGEKEFKVHRVILAAHSPVFKKMFETEMREQKEGRVVLDDATPDVIEELLTYMYTGELPNLMELKEERFQAADKYEITCTHLKAVCEAALCDNITVDNALDMLILADSHNAEQLRALCKHFIGDRLTEVRNTPLWGNLSTSHPELYMELLESQLSPTP